jgi:opacity protein-like surface antigen
MRLNWRAALPLALPLTLAATAATAQTNLKESAITVYGAYRDGGSFIDASTDQKLRLDGSSAWAISYDKGLDGSRQLQFYISYQSTDLGLEQSVTAPPATGTTRAPLPMKVVYFHFGGTNFFDGQIGQGPYLVGGLGATLFKPELAGYSDELRPSLNLGIGYQVALGERVALRVETRGYVTLVNSSGGLFCSGGCLFTIKGDAVTQGEVQLGLSYRF